MRNSHRGFIPLVAIILLGLVAVGGGVVATISLKAPAASHATPGQTDSLPPVTSRVESSVTATASTSNSGVQAPVGQIEANVEAGISLDPRSKEICDRIALEPKPINPSLTGDLLTLCERLGKGDYSSAEEAEASGRLQEKWELWLKVQKAEEPAKNRAQDIENTTR